MLRQPYRKPLLALMEVNDEMWRDDRSEGERRIVGPCARRDRDAPERCRQHQPATGHDSRSFFSSARSVSASSGVQRSTSTARSRAATRSSPAGGGANSGSCSTGARCRSGHRGSSAARQLVLLQAGQNLAGAFDDVRRQPGEARHLDAVAAIGSPRQDLPQEHDVVVVLARRDVKVDHTRDRIGQVGELVIVRGEQRLGARARVRRQVFGDGPRDAETVERGRAAADFVEHDEASRRGEVQDRRRLLHLDHERRVPARDVVRGADAREDAIDERQLRLPRRHERARPAPSGTRAPSAEGMWTCRPCSGRSGPRADGWSS